MGAAPAADAGAAAPTPLAREFCTLDDYEAMKSMPSSSAAPAFRPAASVSAWSLKSSLTDNEAKPALGSAAFPSMPSSKGSLNGREKAPVAASPSPPPPPAATQRTWVASLSGPEEQPAAHPSANYASFPIRQPPPPPPPRSDGPATAGSVFVGPGTHSMSSFRTEHRQTSSRMSRPSSISSQLSDPSSLLSSLQGAAAADGHPLAPASLPVGAAYVDHGAPDAKLTKAQKKNLKRAEKKARQGVAGEYVDEGGPCRLQQGLTESPHIVQCMQCLAHFKAMCCLNKLSVMGFDHWQCVAAIQRVGADGDRASDWICDHLCDERSWIDDVTAYNGPAVSLDVSQEMEIIEAVLQVLLCEAADVHLAVVESKGNLYDALSRLLNQCAHMQRVHVGTESALAVLQGL